ncbi:hypothetical protein CASFOL_015792 [Castilleja foliolosa]|uniref:KIB1-4 beta-propeller domain-containing protein n=1 Tax=Castilleja foliolosa TaxID=1961234 RepID=A0ABD3DIG9_9LAMI
MKKRHIVPLLLTSHGFEYCEQSFYSVIENRYETKNHLVLEGKCILGSAYGWLVLTALTDSDSIIDLDPYDCCLWNPESKEKIQLPRLNDEGQFYNRCVLSKPPTDPDCFVMFKHYFVNKLSVCRIGDDEFVEATLESLVAISSLEGEIYGIVKHGSHYELVTIHLVGKTVEFKPLINGKCHWVVPEVCRSWVSSHFNYLIESPRGAGEFFVVTMTYKLGFFSDYNVEFRVFRLDVNGLVCEELENLDGHTIFIGVYGDGFCCTSDGMGIKPNSIYYTARHGVVLSVYDLDDRSTTQLLPCPVVAGRYEGSINYWVNYWVDLPDILRLE